jgi:hypothetical protein
MRLPFPSLMPLILPLPIRPPPSCTIPVVPDTAALSYTVMPDTPVCSDPCTPIITSHALPPPSPTGPIPSLPNALLGGQLQLSSCLIFPYLLTSFFVRGRKNPVIAQRDDSSTLQRFNLRPSIQALPTAHLRVTTEHTLFGIVTAFILATMPTRSQTQSARVGIGGGSIRRLPFSKAKAAWLFRRSRRSISLAWSCSTVEFLVYLLQRVRSTSRTVKWWATRCA